MTRQDQRAYVRRWVETGQILEQIRWRELRALDAADPAVRTTIPL
jgi:hypothetical protein